MLLLIFRRPNHNEALPLREWYCNAESNTFIQEVSKGTHQEYISDHFMSQPWLGRPDSRNAILALFVNLLV